MVDPLVSLVAANVAFVGSHVALSHPLRAPFAGMLGEKGFAGLYSLLSIALIGWVAMAFRALGVQPPLWDHGDLGWIVASVLTIVALTLVLGSFKGNPALPQTGRSAVAAARADGVFAVTRHPMMWGFGLWALAHLVAWPSPRTLVTAGAMGFLALVGAHLQDRKKAALLGDDWQAWQARTSYWPQLSGFARISPLLWLAALVVWLGISWLHGRAGVAPAGLWRWL